MKKLNKLFAILVAMAMVLSLGVVSAFAAAGYDETQGAVIGGTEADPATGVITKALQMPSGTTTPATTFKFNWEQVTNKTDDGIEATPVKANNKLGKEITITAGQEAPAADVASVKTVIGIADLVGTNTTKHVDETFAKAGRYQFEVTETSNTNGGQNTPADGIDADENQTLSYSDEKYLVTIDVAQGENGLYVENIAVQKWNSETETWGAKGNPSSQTTTDGKQLGSDFKFTNTYVKTQNVIPDGKDPSGPTVDDSGLYIQKKVAPKSGDQLTDADKAAPFTFTVTVAKPSLSDKEAYNAQIVAIKDDGTGIDTSVAAQDVVFTLATADAAATETTPATVKGACTKEITLKHNQRLVFTDLDVGATYTVAETEDAGYTAAYVKTAEGTAAASVTGLSTNGTITEKDDSVAYTNTSKKDSKPTGILISNLPYIALALVAIGGLVAYVVVRRKADDEA